nr:hypothetical protein [Pantoea ananatis]
MNIARSTVYKISGEA